MANGTLTVNGEHDWLKVALQAGQAYAITLSGGTAYKQLRVGTAADLDEGVSADGFSPIAGAPGTPAVAFFRPDASGTYYIDVSDLGGTGSYTVSAAAVATTYTNNVTTTGAVAVGASTTGALTVNGEHDWLKVALQAGQAYAITLSGGTAYKQLRVGTAADLDEGVSADGFSPIAGAPGTPAVAFFRPDASGTYYIDVSDLGGTGSYTVSAAAVATTYTNNVTTTGAVAVGASTTGALTVNGEHDWLKVALQAGQAYAITLSGGTAYKQLRVGTAADLDEGVSADGFSPIAGAPGTPAVAFFRPDASGTYYIDVSDLGGTGSYTVSAAAVATTYTNNVTTTGAVAVGASTTGALTVNGEHDWLKVALQAGQAYAITLSGGTAYKQLRVGTAADLDEGVSADGFSPIAGAPGTPAVAFFRPDASGTYYIDVSDLGGTGSYTVSAAAVATTYTNNVTTTGAVAVGASTTGALTVNGEHDWLKVALQAGQAYAITLSGGTAYKQLRVGTAADLDEGVSADGFSPIAGAPGTPAVAFFRPDASGTYYIDVSDLGGTGSYTVSAAAVATTYTNNINTTGSVTVFPPSPDPLFDAGYYLAHNPDVAAAGVDPYAHYMANGWHEGRAPDAFFDSRYYLQQNPDVAAAGIDPLTHFEVNGWREGRDPSLLFSDSKYLAANPDVAAAGVDPLLHYLVNGKAEGRMAFLSGGTAPADPLVQAAFYDPQLGATLIPTGAAAAQQAAASYNATGWRHGLNPDALFDTAYYLSHNPDVAAAGVNPLLHYEVNGWKEGRDPSAAFSTGKYLAAYADVRAAGVDPLLHYVANGQAEGRTAFHV